MEIIPVEKSELPADFGSKPKPMILEINDFYENIDPRYQRGMVSEDKIMLMVHNFSWTAFKSLLLGQREDGTFWVVDGQQRMHAAALCGFKKVPCEVFQSNGWRHEAKIYNLINSPEHITHLKPHEVFKGVVAFKGEPHFTIHNFLKTISLRVGGSSGTKSIGIIAFPRRVVDNWKMDSEACKKALRLQYSLFGADSPMNVNIHKGLFYLFHCGLPIDNAFCSKKLQETGRSKIIGSISDTRGASGEAHGKVCGLGILKIINKGLRSGKFVLPP